VTIEELAAEYIRKTARVFSELKILHGQVCPDEERVKEVIEEAERYFKDAKYYLDIKRFEVSLASIAYCEGLLDALRMLRFIKFSW
jgi:FAD synthetase